MRKASARNQNKYVHDGYWVASKVNWEIAKIAKALEMKHETQ